MKDKTHQKNAYIFKKLNDLVLLQGVKLLCKLVSNIILQVQFTQGLFFFCFPVIKHILTLITL